MLEYNGEKYVAVSEVARRFKISHRTCSKNVLPLLTACYLPGRRRPVYKQSEVEELSRVRTVEKQVQPLTLVPQDQEIVCIEGTLCKEIV